MSRCDNDQFLVVMDLQEGCRGPFEDIVMEFVWKEASFQNDLNLLPGYFRNAKFIPIRTSWVEYETKFCKDSLEIIRSNETYFIDK
jgi:hypothetical protein